MMCAPCDYGRYPDCEDMSAPHEAELIPQHYPGLPSEDY